MEKYKINYSKIFDELFPINRSILGPGYKKSLKIIKKFIPFKEEKYKSGRRIFDWVVPKEWVIQEGFIKFKGKKILNFKDHNLKVIAYSDKVNKFLNLNEIKNKIFFFA